MPQRVPSEIGREEMLEAALACFDDIGFEAASLEAIAERCGIPVLRLSEEFADKGAIRKALVSMWSERLSAWMLSA